MTKIKFTPVKERISAITEELAMYTQGEAITLK